MMTPEMKNATYITVGAYDGRKRKLERIGSSDI